MGLDYGHTCPDIDFEIKGIKEDIESHLINFSDELSPLFEGDKKDEFIKTYIDGIYSDLENHFESVRKSNEDMRREADNQINNKDEEIESYKDEISDLESKISDLEQQLSDL